MSDLGEEGERSFLVKWDILITLVIHTWCGRVLCESSGRSAVALRLSVQLCPTLCDSIDCSMPGFPVHH